MMQKINNSADHGIRQEHVQASKHKSNDSTIKDNSEKFANQITKNKKDKSAKQNKEMQEQIKYSPEHLLSKKHINKQTKGKKNNNQLNHSINENNKKLANQDLSEINKKLTNQKFNENDKKLTNQDFSENDKKLTNQNFNENNKNKVKHAIIDKNEYRDLKDKSLEFVNDLNIQQTQLSHVPEVKVASLNQDIKAHLQNMVDKIHTSVISSNKGISGAEVKIQLKDTILPETKIHIQRIGSELVVSFETSAEQSKNLLAKNESSLQKLLTEKFENNKIQININLSQDHQGRSRNEYIADEQADDETKR